MVVECTRGKPNEWVIYHDVASVVDAIHADRPYRMERRYRDENGQLFAVTRSPAMNVLAVSE